MNLLKKKLNIAEKYKPNASIVAFKKDVFKRSSKVSSFVYQVGESELLRNPSTEVPLKNINSLEFKEKVKYLKKCLLRYRKITGVGRGITAVQVGIP